MGLIYVVFVLNHVCIVCKKRKKSINFVYYYFIILQFLIQSSFNPKTLNLLENENLNSSKCQLKRVGGGQVGCLFCCPGKI